MKHTFLRHAFYKIISGVTAVIFLLTSSGPGFAQGVTDLPEPGKMVALSEAFQPPALAGVKVFVDDPFRLDFVVERGTSSTPEVDEVKLVSDRLVRYFMASLTVPEDDLFGLTFPRMKRTVLSLSRSVLLRWGVTFWRRIIFSSRFHRV